PALVGGAPGGNLIAPPRIGALDGGDGRPGLLGGLAIGIGADEPLQRLAGCEPLRLGPRCLATGGRLGLLRHHPGLAGAPALGWRRGTHGSAAWRAEPASVVGAGDEGDDRGRRTQNADREHGAGAARLTLPLRLPCGRPAAEPLELLVGVVDELQLLV